MSSVGASFLQQDIFLLVLTLCSTFFLGWIIGGGGKKSTIPEGAQQQPIVQKEPEYPSDRGNCLDSYRELRKQFQEKSEVLHQTRSELFHLEGEFFLFKRQSEEAELAGDPIIETWQKEVGLLQEEKEALGQENLILQEILASAFANEPSLSLKDRKKINPKVPKGKIDASLGDFFLQV